jgi:cation diffusion facilitator family transporter
MAGSTRVVLAALFANGAIAICKFVGFLLTGSPAMLSETYHSVSDTGNQVFLLIGIRYSGREATRTHPFGYGKAQFFYAFLVSVFLFGIAGWESLKHGWGALTAHGGHGSERADVVLGGVNVTDLVQVDPFYVNVVVLLAAIVFEAYALKKANAELRRQMREFGWADLREAFRRTSDVTTLTAFTEDTIAMGGAAIALVGITAARYTGNQIYDAIAAISIGLLLMGFALALAWENKRLLLGESLPADIEATARDRVAARDGVEHVDVLKSMYVGPQSVLATVEVSLEPGLDTADVDAIITDIEDTIRDLDSRIEIVYVEPET